MNFKRKISCILFFIVVLIPITIFSQENFVKGTIIKQNNDTVSGYIDYQNWEINPDKISFKKTLSDNKLEFSAFDIKEFHVNNEIYESGFIQIEKSSNLVNELTSNPEMEFEGRTTFLQAFVRGEKSLYLYKTKKQKDVPWLVKT